MKPPMFGRNLKLFHCSCISSLEVLTESSLKCFYREGITHLAMRLLEKTPIKGSIVSALAHFETDSWFCPSDMIDSESGVVRL